MCADNIVDAERDGAGLAMKQAQTIHLCEWKLYILATTQGQRGATTALFRERERENYARPGLIGQ
jgi:hypothetical protein